MLNIIAGTLSTGAPPVAPSSYESIATVSVGSGGSSSIDFTSIPATYKHLQLRYLDLSTSSAGDMRVQVNADTGNSYSRHFLYGTGAAAASGGVSTTDYMLVGQSGGSTYPSVGVIDILDYADTNKNKTLRTLSGYDVNGSGGYILLISGAYYSTSAISSIKIFISGNSFNQYSSFALYGIKGV